MMTLETKEKITLTSEIKNKVIGQLDLIEREYQRSNNISFDDLVELEEMKLRVASGDVTILELITINEYVLKYPLSY